MKSNFTQCILNYLFLEWVLFLNFGIKCGTILNIHSNELLCIETKESRINENKNIFKIDNLNFLPNNIFTRLFKEFKKYIYKNDYQ